SWAPSPPTLSPASSDTKVWPRRLRARASSIHRLRMIRYIQLSRREPASHLPRDSSARSMVIWQRSSASVRSRARPTANRRSRELMERGVCGAPARGGERLWSEPTPEELAKAEGSGFGLVEQYQIEGLGFTVARLTVPSGLSLANAQKRLGNLLPGADVCAE